MIIAVPFLNVSMPSREVLDYRAKEKRKKVVCQLKSQARSSPQDDG